uniref:Protein kinase domain-containing protein n=1 Tax=Acrobeloides nanus TaxID=290746 RepID=A0A914EST5_9BILA
MKTVHFETWENNLAAKQESILNTTWIKLVEYTDSVERKNYEKCMIRSLDQKGFENFEHVVMIQNELFNFYENNPRNYSFCTEEEHVGKLDYVSGTKIRDYKNGIFHSVSIKIALLLDRLNSSTTKADVDEIKQFILSILDGCDYNNHKIFHIDRPNSNSFIKECEIKPRFIEVMDNEKLGEGAFSTVYKGILKTKKCQLNLNHHNHNNDITKPDIDIAIKVFYKENSSIQKFVTTDPWREIRIIKRIEHHRFIVNMYGWANMPFHGPCLILEYCSNGNLLKFLQRLRPLIKDYTFPTAPYENCLSLNDLIARAWQISDAMVADFGLCRCTADTPYVMTGGILPLKWMPIEGLKMIEFSEKTDVWSFGVLLYEMFSIGLQPYHVIEASRGHQFTQEGLLEYLQEGGRLEQPQLCPKEVYTLMMSCWKENPQNRPSFQEIREELERMIEAPDKEYGYVKILEDSDFSVTYANIIKKS